jgi:hypothetical protein
MMHSIQIMKAATRVMHKALQTSEKVESMDAMHTMDEAAVKHQNADSIVAMHAVSLERRSAHVHQCSFQRKPKTKNFMVTIRAMNESGSCSGLSLHRIGMRIPRSQFAP